MGTKGRAPFELAAGLGAGLDQDVGDLSRKPGDTELRRLDDLDPFDVAGADLAQFVDRATRLIGDALAVDQDILRRLAKPALLVGAADGEARDLDQHVVGGLG